MLHAVLHQLRQLLSFGAPVQVEPLLRDALRPAGRFGALPAQSPRPLHALLPQQRVLRLVAAGGVPVRRFLLPGLSSLAVLGAVLGVDGQLRLGEQRSNVRSPPSQALSFTFGMFL